MHMHTSSTINNGSTFSYFLVFVFKNTLAYAIKELHPEEHFEMRSDSC